MKANDVLKQYAEGRRDFRGEDLRGQNFREKDLSGGYFSECDYKEIIISSFLIEWANDYRHYLAWHQELEQRLNNVA